MNERRTTGGWTRRTVVGIVAWMIVAVAGPVHAATPEPLFRQDFGQTEVGALPEGFLVLDGQFGVKAEGAERFLELPGAPLDTYGVMFGPARKEDWGALARFYGTSQGRRFPSFGVSVGGVGGYRVQVSPAKRALELLKGDDVLASSTFAWESGSWTQVRIQVCKTAEGAWQVQGKAWKDGGAEPTEWMVTRTETEAPITGRAAVWGKPFSGTPIRFDDLKVLPLEK